MTLKEGSKLGMDRRFHCFDILDALHPTVNVKFVVYSTVINRELIIHTNITFSLLS